MKKLKSHQKELQCMIRIFIGMLLIFTSTVTFAATGSIPLKPVLIDLNNKASLQRGAQIYVNNCLGCHTLKYQRYVKFIDHLSLSKETIENNLIFTTGKNGEPTKIGSLMLNAVNPDSAKEAFGVMPPDLTLIARSRGTEWLYTFLTSFYKDDTRPLGVNNALYPNVGMPHVLSWMEGLKKPVNLEKDQYQYIIKGTMTDKEYQKSMTDLVNFLAYVSEPAQLDRYRIGFWVILFLAIFSFLAFLLKIEYWKDVK
ncbi:MAG: cytochrome c1 [Gammaproteobacteria bacterium]|nr:cytochrome c1 [Gammaproteobacteria bacterium]MBV04335.1 cytochrome c1 [Paracoccaceae bacterium]